MIEIVASDDAVLAHGDIIAVFNPIPGENWLSGGIETVDDRPHLRVNFVPEVLEYLENGIHENAVVLLSASGTHRSGQIEVIIDLFLEPPEVDAGEEVTAVEGSTLVLLGSTDEPGNVVSVEWVQTSGPPVVITDAETFSPTVQLPFVDELSLAGLSLEVGFATGQTVVAQTQITILPIATIESLEFTDPMLSDCVNQTAINRGWTDAPDVTEISCSGVVSLVGIEALTSLQSLELPDNSLVSIGELLELAELAYLDVTGNSSLHCEVIDQLALELELGSSLIVDDTCLSSTELDLGAPGVDLAVSSGLDLAFVSVPERNEVVVVALDEFRVVDRYRLAGNPYGIDVSIDDTRLFAAMGGSNKVSVVDISSRGVSEILLGDSLDHPATFDVVEAETNRLFVTASPGSSGLAYVAQVRLDQGNAVTRVADDRIIRGSPHLARDPAGQFVYVSEGFSPNSLYKLSLSDVDAGVVLEDDHGSVGGTDNMAINASGTRIALRSGQVLRTGSFEQEGTVGGGASFASRTENNLFVAAANGSIISYDFGSLLEIETISTNCLASPASRVASFNDDSSFLLLQNDVLCIFGQRSTTSPIDPYSQLRMLDLAFEDCVIAEAILMGYDSPDDFLQLDCSVAASTILDIEGIEQFVNLEDLDISNSGVIDLTPLASVGSLRSLQADGASISNVDSLLELPFLTSVSLTGNHGIDCSVLDSIVETGVSVTTDACSQLERVELGGIGAGWALDLVNDRVFVSVPSTRSVVDIDLASGVVASSLSLTEEPHGIALNAAGDTLYAAYNSSGDLAIVDLATEAIDVVDLSVELDDDRAWDVAEVSADRVVVSANPGSNGFAYIVEVRLDLGNAAQRVASETIIRARPVFAVSPDGTSVYVGSGFSPNSLYKLDATQSSLPLILEDDHGEVSGTESLALSPDGSTIFLASGQALSTDSFNQVGIFPAGRSAVTSDGNTLLVASAETDSAVAYDISTGGAISHRSWGCDIEQVTALSEFGEYGVVALGEDLVCFSRVVAFP